MGSAALDEVDARLGQAQLPIDGEVHIGGVFVLLAVVFPPANRAQRQRGRNIQGSISTAGAAIRETHQ